LSREKFIELKSSIIGRKNPSEDSQPLEGYMARRILS